MKNNVHLFLLTLCALSPAYAGLEFSIYNGTDKPIKHTHAVPEFQMNDIQPHSNAGGYIPRVQDRDSVGELGWSYHDDAMCLSTPVRGVILINTGHKLWGAWPSDKTGSLIGKIIVNGKTTDLADFFKDPSKLVRGTWSNETITIKKDDKTGKNVPVFTPDKDGVLRTPDGQTPNSFACDTTIHFVVDKNGKVAREENGITMSLP